jgi:hypothetical protein
VRISVVFMEGLRNTINKVDQDTSFSNVYLRFPLICSVCRAIYASCRTITLTTMWCAMSLLRYTQSPINLHSKLLSTVQAVCNTHHYTEIEFKHNETVPL